VRKINAWRHSKAAEKKNSEEMTAGLVPYGLGEPSDNSRFGAGTWLAPRLAIPSGSPTSAVSIFSDFLKAPVTTLLLPSAIIQNTTSPVDAMQPVAYTLAANGR
jgi:hypothetical protein